jgi:hypothetical protein
LVPILLLVIGIPGAAKDEPGSGAISSGPSLRGASGSNPGARTYGPTLDILSFENPDSLSTSAGEWLTMLVASELRSSGRFEFVQVILDRDAGEPTENPENPAQESAYTLTGKLTRIGYENVTSGGAVASPEAVVVAEFVLTKSRSGREVLSGTVEGREPADGSALHGSAWIEWIESVDAGSGEFTESPIGKACATASTSLAEKINAMFPIRTRVLAVDEEEGFLVLAGGASRGIQEGDEFDIFRLVPVVDSSGEVVWMNQELMGRVQVTDLEDSGCKAAILSGSGFEEMDLAVLSTEE